MFRTRSSLIARHIATAYRPGLVVHPTENILTDPTRPTALILGFGGSQPKHIQKHANVYARLGLASVSYTGIDWDDDVPKADEVFAPLFEHQHYADRPLTVHCVSMNGFRSLCKLYRWMTAERVDASKKISGIVFDSCPSFVPSRVLAHGRVTTRPPFDINTDNFLAEMPSAYKRTAYTKLLHRMKSPRLIEEVNYFYMQHKVDLPKKQLYIYSKDDELIDYRWTEKFMQSQKEKGKIVARKRFDSSPHVQHIRTNAIAYEKEIGRFLDRKV